MRLKCIGCEALARIIYYCAARSTHIVDISLFQIGLHDQPADLRRQIQKEINSSIGQGYDALVLGYALCGKATEGIKASDIPLVIPRAHDCITLFLGSRQRYNDQFSQNPGTYWYTQDWLERRDHSGKIVSLGDAVWDMSQVYDEYVKKFGKDNADYLMEVMGAWQSHYNRAVYINLPIGTDSSKEEQVVEEAKRRGWSFEGMMGDQILIQKLLNGDWDDDFLIIQPHQQIQMSGGAEIMCAVESHLDE